MVEGTGLENRRAGDRTVGSNPTSSAIFLNCLPFPEDMSKVRHKRAALSDDLGG